MSDAPKWKNRLDGVQSILTSLAIIAGGWWFFFQAEANNKAKCSHSLTLVPVHTNFLWANLEVKVENVGKRTLHLDKGIFKVSQVKPVKGSPLELMDDGISPVLADDNRAEWPILSYHERKLGQRILPGETDYIYYEFAVPTNVSVLRVYSYFATGGKKDFGWPKISVYTFNNGRLTTQKDTDEK